jgi:hypothetical protein
MVNGRPVEKHAQERFHTQVVAAPSASATLGPPAVDWLSVTFRDQGEQ